MEWREEWREAGCALLRLLRLKASLRAGGVLALGNSHALELFEVDNSGLRCF
jgi:hypothetical protein